MVSRSKSQVCLVDLGGYLCPFLNFFNFILQYWIDFELSFIMFQFVFY